MNSMIRISEQPKARDVGYEHVEVAGSSGAFAGKRRGAVKVLPVSTGSGDNFIDDGETSIAYTRGQVHCL